MFQCLIIAGDRLQIFFIVHCLFSTAAVVCHIVQLATLRLRLAADYSFDAVAVPFVAEKYRLRRLVVDGLKLWIPAASFLRLATI